MLISFCFSKIILRYLLLILYYVGHEFYIHNTLFNYVFNNKNTQGVHQKYSHFDKCKILFLNHKILRKKNGVKIAAEVITNEVLTGKPLQDLS